MTDPQPTDTDVTKEWRANQGQKSAASRLRLFAAIAWVVAIGTEIAGVVLLRQHKFDHGNLALLIGLLVVIAVFAIAGSLMWKAANRHDPASKADSARFFFQNQLGAIITVVAFVPLIVLIFTNKNMNGQQKGIAGAIGIVLLLVAGYFGTSINPPSTEQYDQETATVVGYTGQDLVFWTKSGKVYHLCQDVSDVNLESKDNTIYSGTVAEAHAAGKSRLTLEVDSELAQCGFDATSAPVEPDPTSTP